MDDSRGKARAPERRVGSARRGYGSRWQKARGAWLAEHPFCAFHLREGRRIVGKVVDHMVPPRLGEALDSGDGAAIERAQQLFWDRKNWQTLCKACHDSVKQAQERSGIASGCNEDGLPIDSNHPWNRGRE